MSAPEPRVEELRVADIVVRDRLRPVSEAGVESLLASIRDLGTIKDEIHVRLARRGGNAEMRLLAGGHRLEAARRLGWDSIRAKVWRDITDDLARLIEVDDNLAGAEMDALDQAIFLSERRRVYENLHPETRRGSAGALRRWDANDIRVVCMESFTTATAAKFGISPRHVQRMAKAGDRLGPGERQRLQGAERRPSQADLLLLAKIDEAGDRIAVVERLWSGQTAREALRALSAEPKPQADPVTDQLRALKAAWSRSGAVARRRWVEEAFEELQELVETEDLRRIEAGAAKLQLIDGGAA